MRPRKKDRHLPKSMYFKHGRYYHVVKGKWHPLSKDYEESMSLYARRTTPEGGIADLIERTLEIADIKPRTLKQYRDVVGRITEAFADFSPEQVKPKHIARFLDHHRKIPSMANRMRTVLKIAFSNAVRWGYVDSSPVVEPRFKEKPRGRYLTDDEYLKIRKNARPWLKVMMDMAYLTGQRVGDIISIKRTDIDGDTIVFKQQKTGNKLAVSNDGIPDAVEAAKALRSVQGIYLFHTGRGEPYSYYTVRGAFKRAAEKAKVEDAQFRDIRAKSATDAEEAGLNPGILLGHSSPQNTKRYLRKKKTLKAVGPKSIGQN